MTTSTGEQRKVGQVPADTFAHRLMLVRAHAGYLTVKDAAERCGLNYGSWSNWERGSQPRDKLEVAAAIAEALDIDYDWLLFGGPLRSQGLRKIRRTGHTDTDQQERSDTLRCPIIPGQRPHRDNARALPSRPHNHRKHLRPVTPHPQGHPNGPRSRVAA